MNPLRIGTRGSALALWQARSVSGELERVAGVKSELVIIKTSGDKFQQTSFSQIGTKGVFIKELEDALIARRIDLAVHSMKDVPTQIPDGLTIAAILKRQDVRDALLSATSSSFTQLPAGARVGTSSLRRQSQLLHLRNDLRMLDLRGNVDTRVEKLKRGDYDAIVLAKAGLDRLGLSENITEVLSTDVCLPATGQGAIGIETRAGDGDILKTLSVLNDADTRYSVISERAALAGLEGGCQASIGAWGRVIDGRLILEVVVLSPDGVRRIYGESSGVPEAAETIGQKLAENLIAQGADKLLVREIRGTTV